MDLSISFLHLHFTVHRQRSTSGQEFLILIPSLSMASWISSKLNDVLLLLNQIKLPRESKVSRMDEGTPTMASVEEGEAIILNCSDH